MATIRANCRQRFSANDFDFVASSLGGDQSLVMELLTDPAALDAALDSDRLFKSVLELPANVTVTPPFYFYVLARRMLCDFDRDVADYIAGVLTEFVKPAPLLPYLTDLLIALRSASSEREFSIRVQVGNSSLFLSGVFPQHIHQRASLSFYEAVGRENYRLASSHRLARENQLAPTYRTLAENFSELRVGLNQLSDRLLCLES